MSSPALFDLTGQVVLITGSSRGIGRAIAERCAAHGAKVVISTGTGGGIGAGIRLGDVVVAEKVLFECTRQFKDLVVDDQNNVVLDPTNHHGATRKIAGSSYKSKPLPTYDQAMQMFGRGSNTTKEQLIEQLQRRRRESREKRKRAEQELKQQKAAAKGQVEAKL